MASPRCGGQPRRYASAAAYPNGDAVSYTYDAGGDRLTRTVNGVPTSYTYDAAGQLLSDGAVTYTYDASGNLTTAGGDTFAWDYADRLTGATVGGTATTYTYDGDGTRVAKTVGGQETNYLWDRDCCLPLLLDDGTNGYLHADGVLAEVDGAGMPKYLLADALGSVRGVADLSGALGACLFSSRTRVRNTTLEGWRAPGGDIGVS